MAGKQINVAVVGYGYWGPNLVRTFSENDQTRVVSCCDVRKERLRLVKNKYPSMGVTTKFLEIINNPGVDAVIIATPLSTHFSLAKMALLAGKHVWIEKPITENSSQARELIDLANKKNKILFVDHIFLYNQAVIAIKKIIEEGGLGKTYYFDSVRINLGLFQPDSNVIWDLAVHDISIMCHLLGKTPQSVSAFASPHVVPNLEDIAYLNFRFSQELSAHINVSWLSPVKIRRTLIAGSKKMIIYDDLETSEKIKIYDAGVSLKKSYRPESSIAGYHYRIGEVRSPAIEDKEALQTASSHFIDCIKTGKKALTDGNQGLRVVKILEAANQSLKNSGRAENI